MSNVQNLFASSVQVRSGLFTSQVVPSVDRYNFRTSPTVPAETTKLTRKFDPLAISDTPLSPPTFTVSRMVEVYVVVVVVLPTVIMFVCGIIAEISPVDAFSIAPLWIRVGGIRTPFHIDPLTVMLVTPERTRLPVRAFESFEFDVTVIVPLRVSPDQEAILAPVRVVAPVFVDEPVRLIGAPALTNDPVEADEIFPTLSVRLIR